MTRLSNRQYPMLKTFAVGGSGYHMSIKDAGLYDQRPFRSMLIQSWIEYKPAKGFHITQAGRDAWKEFENTEIFRRNPLGPLTAYFDPTAYGLKVTEKPKTRKVA
jgi:hypothetical protein